MEALRSRPFLKAISEKPCIVKFEDVNYRQQSAQWKRDGPITQGSDDQNLALLVFFIPLRMFKGDLPPLFLLFYKSN